LEKPKMLPVIVATLLAAAPAAAEANAFVSQVLPAQQSPAQSGAPQSAGQTSTTPLRGSKRALVNSINAAKLAPPRYSVSIATVDARGRVHIDCDTLDREPHAAGAKR
jgi:hypothetical protein